MLQSQPATPSKRKSLRSPILVTKVKEESNGPKVFLGYAKNISRTGLFIQTINPKKQNEVLCIEFSLPGSEKSLTCAAEVIWKRDFSANSKYQPGMGIMFLDMPENNASTIEKWVVERIENKY